MNKITRGLSAAVFTITMTVSLITPALAGYKYAGEKFLATCEDSSSVYYVNNYIKHVFPNEKIYKSWYGDENGAIFAEVREISCEELATYSFGEPVRYQPGTRLIKVPSLPKVYAVESDGTLRPIKDEQQAAALYGEHWAQRVDDLSEIFFPDYTIGEEIEGTKYPEGTLLRDTNHTEQIYRIDRNGEAIEIGDLLLREQWSNALANALYIEDVESRLGIRINVIQQQDQTDLMQMKQNNRLSPVSKETYTTQEYENLGEFIDDINEIASIASMVEVERDSLIAEAQKEIDAGAEYTLEDIEEIMFEIENLGKTAQQIARELEAINELQEDPFKSSEFELLAQKVIDSVSTLEIITSLADNNIEGAIAIFRLTRTEVAISLQELRTYELAQ